jgi:FMN phosphatase YigB (HAD superfamily)
MRLTDFNVLTFDCYGTLIDWETGILNALRPRFGSELVEALATTFWRHLPGWRAPRKPRRRT